LRVLILGSGVAGLSLTYFLSKVGALITVVEKAPAILPHGQNVDITGTAVTVIKKMDLKARTRRYNTTEKGTQLIISTGQKFAPFSVKKDSIASFTSECKILRGDMSKILWEASRVQPNVEYMFSMTVQQVLHNDDDSVKVVLSNSAVHEHDLLVAADGQWSMLRKQIFAPESVNVRCLLLYPQNNKRQ